jgi:hypothetical protein
MAVMNRLDPGQSTADGVDLGAANVGKWQLAAATSQGPRRERRRQPLGKKIGRRFEMLTLTSDQDAPPPASAQP